MARVYGTHPASQSGHPLENGCVPEAEAAGEGGQPFPMHRDEELPEDAAVVGGVHGPLDGRRLPMAPPSCVEAGEHAHDHLQVRQRAAALGARPGLGLGFGLGLGLEG